MVYRSAATFELNGVKSANETKDCSESTLVGNLLTVLMSSLSLLALSLLSSSLSLPLSSSSSDSSIICNN